MPFLKSIQTFGKSVNVQKYPFNIPAFSEGINMEFSSNATFFVGGKRIREIDATRGDC